MAGKRGSMIGNEIRRLRELLRMPVPLYAQLFGVNVTTAYRWENAGTQTVPLDPPHAALLARLQQTVDARPTQARRSAWGKRLMTDLRLGGTLAGIATLLIPRDLGELVQRWSSNGAPTEPQRVKRAQ